MSKLNTELTEIDRESLELTNTKFTIFRCKAIIDVIFILAKAIAYIYRMNSVSNNEMSRQNMDWNVQFDRMLDICSKSTIDIDRNSRGDRLFSSCVWRQLNVCIDNDLKWMFGTVDGLNYTPLSLRMHHLSTIDHRLKCITKHTDGIRYC